VQAEGARLRIKNGHGIVVALGGTRQAASGVRPGKKVWTLEVGADLAGGVGELDDVTPGAACKPPAQRRLVSRRPKGGL
jgi:hypothetical protein